MIAVFSFLVVLVLSLLVVRIATVALTLTGLSRPLARFQARSAFTGAGFTTDEAERVVGHPVRRRIIMLLMLLGNAGVVSALASLIISFIGSSEDGGLFASFWFKVLALAVGLTILWHLAHSPFVDRHLSRIITAALRKYTKLEVRDYAGLLHLSGDYAVSELQVNEGDWCAGTTLAALNLTAEGLIVLGIEKGDGTYVGAPRGDSHIDPGDTLIVYGPDGKLEDLDRRRADAMGNWQHVQSVDEQRRRERDEAQREAEAEVKLASKAHQRES